jgi:hypothetical protein
MRCARSCRSRVSAEVEVAIAIVVILPSRRESGSRDAAAMTTRVGKSVSADRR